MMAAQISFPFCFNLMAPLAQYLTGPMVVGATRVAGLSLRATQKSLIIEQNAPP